MPHTIMVGYNQAEAGERAFQYALELAKQSQATLSVLAVAWPSGAPTALEMTGLMGSQTEHFGRAFVRMHQAAKVSGVPLQAKTLVGHPAKQIIREAKSQGADLIVVAHRGKDWIERWLSRSVAKRLLGHAPCPVMIVP